jgi:hypothetical protein
MLDFLLYLFVLFTDRDNETLVISKRFSKCVSKYSKTFEPENAKIYAEYHRIAIT